MAEERSVETRTTRKTVGGENINVRRTETIERATLWAFFARLLSAIAAAVGGYPATPKDIPANRRNRLSQQSAAENRAISLLPPNSGRAEQRRRESLSRQPAGN